MIYGYADVSVGSVSDAFEDVLVSPAMFHKLDIRLRQFSSWRRAGSSAAETFPPAGLTPGSSCSAIADQSGAACIHSVSSSGCWPSGGGVTRPVMTRKPCASTGKTEASFPAASCTCPILNGNSSAKPGSGNMPLNAAPGAQGVCAPPDGDKTMVWSLFAEQIKIPQAPTWKSRPARAQTCASMGPNGFANCFSFSCVETAPAKNGQALATCTCPVNEAATGAAAPPTNIAIKAAGGCDVLVVGTNNPSSSS